MVANDPVTEQIGTDLEADLVDAGLQEAHARAMRRAVERTVDRLVANFATRAELHAVRDELRAEIRDSISNSERKISTQLRIMWAVLALVGSGLFALMAAILTKM